jgi:serine protease Do
MYKMPCWEKCCIALTACAWVAACLLFLPTWQATADAPPIPAHLSVKGVVAAAIPYVVEVKVTKQGLYSVKESFAAGIIVDDSRALTCQHVVRGALTVSVVLPDGSEVKGEVVAEDASGDMALIKAPGSHAHATFAATPAEVGDEIIAIGHPQGFKNSVSKGLVSGVNRDVPLVTGNTLHHQMQTSLNVHPGCSGGPLLNLDGEVVGIQGSAVNDAHDVSFAIPASAIKAFLAANSGE